MHTPTLVRALAEGRAVVDVACGALCTFRVATRLPLAMQVARTARQWESESEFREVLLWSDEEAEVEAAAAEEAARRKGAAKARPPKKQGASRERPVKQAADLSALV